MEPLTMIAVGWCIIKAVAVVLYFWPKIVEYFRKVVLPWLRHMVPGRASVVVEDLFLWLDGIISPARQVARKLIARFIDTVLSQQTTYTQQKSGEWVERQETKYKGRSKSEVEERIYSLDELPREVRQEIVQSDAGKVKRDNKDAVIQKARERAKEDYGDDTLVMEVAG